MGQSVTDEMFCAGDLIGEIDSCHADSGGPLVVNNKLAGIFSWGDGCKHGTYGVYTSVTSQRLWILKQLKNMYSYYPYKLCNIFSDLF